MFQWALADLPMYIKRLWHPCAFSTPVVLNFRNSFSFNSLFPSTDPLHLKGHSDLSLPTTGSYLLVFRICNGGTSHRREMKQCFRPEWFGSCAYMYVFFFQLIQQRILPFGKITWHFHKKFNQLCCQFQTPLNTKLNYWIITQNPAWKQQDAWMFAVYGYSWPIYILTEYIRSLSPEEDLGDICSVLCWSCICRSDSWMNAEGEKLSTSTVSDLCPTFFNFPNSFTC